MKLDHFIFTRNSSGKKIAPNFPAVYFDETNRNLLSFEYVHYNKSKGDLNSIEYAQFANLVSRPQENKRGFVVEFEENLSGVVIEGEINYFKNSELKNLAKNYYNKIKDEITE